MSIYQEVASRKFHDTISFNGCGVAWNGGRVHFPSLLNASHTLTLIYAHTTLIRAQIVHTDEDGPLVNVTTQLMCANVDETGPVHCSATRLYCLTPSA